MFRADEQRQYAYDQEYYDKWAEHAQLRPSGEGAREIDRQRRRKKKEARGVGGGDEQQSNERVQAELQASQDGERVYAPVGGDGGQDVQEAQDDAAKGQGKQLSREAARGTRDERASKGDVKIDKARRAFVRRRH